MRPLATVWFVLREGISGILAPEILFTCFNLHPAVALMLIFWCFVFQLIYERKGHIATIELFVAMAENWCDQSDLRRYGCFSEVSQQPVLYGSLVEPVGAGCQVHSQEFPQRVQSFLALSSLFPRSFLALSSLFPGLHLMKVKVQS